MPDDGNRFLKFLFGFSATVLGAFAGVVLSCGVVYACSEAVGGPQDLGVAIILGFAAVGAGAGLGAAAGYYLSRKAGPPQG